MGVVLDQPAGGADPGVAPVDQHVLDIALADLERDEVAQSADAPPPGGGRRRAPVPEPAGPAARAAVRRP